MDANVLVQRILSRRSKVRWGIGTARSYRTDLEACIQGGLCPTDAFGLKAADVESSLPAMDGKLIYADEQMRFTGFQTKAAGSLSANSIMDFECVITSRRQDRDGDVLEPKGANPDPAMPFLWQHNAALPVGKLLAITNHTNTKVCGKFAIYDVLNGLGQDTAFLIENGALRISHGFQPEEYEPLDEKDGEGWHILKYTIMETSGVSVPSNPDAVITFYSRGKLHNPLVKSWAKSYFDARPVSVAPGYSVRERVGDVEHEVKLASYEEVKDFVGLGKGAAGDAAVKAAVPYAKTPAATEDAEWDADQAVANLRKWAGVDEDEPSNAAWKKYSKGFAYVRGDGTKLGDFVLPHHDVKDGELVVVYGGLSAAVAAVNGSRGGVTWEEESDRKAVYDHLARHYKDSFPDKEVPELKAMRFTTKSINGTKHFCVELDGSWGDIQCQLSEDLEGYLLMHGVKLESDQCVYICEMFDDRAVVCIYDYYSGAWELWAIGWAMVNDEPKWNGEPVPVEISATLQERMARMLTKDAKTGRFTMHVTKAGRALSSKNEESIRDAQTLVEEVAKRDDVSKPAKTQLKEASSLLAAVLKQVEESGDGGSDGEEEDEEKRFGDTLAKALGFVLNASEARREKCERFLAAAVGAMQAAKASEEQSLFARIYSGELSLN